MLAVHVLLRIFTRQTSKCFSHLFFEPIETNTRDLSHKSFGDFEDMKRNQTGHTHVGILATILLSCSIGFSLEPNWYHSPANGYWLAIPQGWVQIPQSVVHEMTNRVLSGQGESGICYETGFQRGITGRWFECPYVLIQVLPYSSFGLNRQIPKSQFGNFVKVISGLDARDLIEKTVSEEAQSLISDAAFGKAYLDSENNSFTRALSMQVANVGKIRGASTSYFGKYAIVQVNYYDRESNWFRSKPERDLILGSLRFDAATAYDETYASEWSLGSHLGEAAFKGVVVGVFFFVLALGWALLAVLRQVLRGCKQSKAERPL